MYTVHFSSVSPGCSVLKTQEQSYYVTHTDSIRSIDLTAYLVDGEGLELGGTKLFERHALVLEVNACDGQSDASGLATGGDSEVVEYGRHGKAGLLVVVVVEVVVAVGEVLVVVVVVVLMWWW